MTGEPYDRIAAAATRRRGASLVVLVVPRGTPVYLSVEKLVPQLEGRGVRLQHVKIDVTGDLAELLESSPSHAAEHEQPEAVVVHGFEGVSKHDAQTYFRRSNFTRGRLAKIARAAFVVVEAEMWSWLVLEVPDLVRWADGPFILPEMESPPHPLDGMISLRAHFGRPIPSGLDFPLDRERGVDAFSAALAGLERGRVVVLGGAPGVGVRHMAVRIEAQLRRRGLTTTWPPPTDNLVETEDWTSGEVADVAIVHGRLSIFPALPQRSTLVLSSIRGILGPESSGVSRVYLPPVVVERLPGAPHESGVQLLTAAAHGRARLLEANLALTVSDDALRLLVIASGGVPGVLWTLLSETSRRAALENVRPATYDLARVAAVDVGRAWLATPPVMPIPFSDYSGQSRRDGNIGLNQILILNKRPVMQRHPLARLADGEDLNTARR